MRTGEKGDILPNTKIVVPFTSLHPHFSTSPSPSRPRPFQSFHPRVYFYEPNRETGSRHARSSKRKRIEHRLDMTFESNGREGIAERMLFNRATNLRQGDSLFKRRSGRRGEKRSEHPAARERKRGSGFSFNLSTTLNSRPARKHRSRIVLA